MAQTVHLSLTCNGENIEGESRIASLERAGTIECCSFYNGLTMIRDATTLRSGTRKYELVRIHKRIDKSTPRLIKALCENERIEARFRFFRPSGGAGAEVHFYTVLLNGYIDSVKQVSEDDLVCGKLAPPMMEEVAFSYQYIEWLYEDGGIDYRLKVC